MPNEDERVGAYIAKARPFARPILKHLRAVVHDACPEIEETIKWGAPHFDHHGMLCMMAAFKQHCTFGFWKGELLLGAKSRNAEAMGDFGRIATLADLPAKSRLKSLVRAAMKLNEAGVKRVARTASAPKKPLRVPRDLSNRLATNPKAAETFAGFPPSQRREYIEWLTEARSEATRSRRLETTVEWLSQGKRRNWKYMKR